MWLATPKYSSESKVETIDMDSLDEFMPYGDKKSTFKKLIKLPLAVLGHLVLHWASKYGTETGMHIEKLQYVIETLQKRKVKRNVLASRVLLEYWPRGLHLYQLAQIDCYLVVHRPALFYWKSSTIYDASNERHIVRFTLEKLIGGLKQDLSKFYLCNVHSFEHPTLPLLVLRIQLFDRSNKFRPQSAEMPTGDYISSNSFIERGLTTRSPFYVAFPSNSSSIIHSPDGDTYSNLILQSIQRVLSYTKPILLKLDETNAVRSLESMQILRGVSRFSHSLGPWSCYADTSFEVSPLGQIEKHQAVTGKRILTPDDLSEDEGLPGAKKPRFEKSMLRFKGSKEGVKAKKAYELKKFSSRIHNPDKDSQCSPTAVQASVSQYTSLVPVEKIDLTLKNKVSESQDHVMIKFKFRGNDVFGGLHELCDRQLLNIDNVPGWLTGENGVESGTIENGEFIRDANRGGLL